MPFERCWQDESQEASMFFLQLPAILPMIKQTATAEAEENTSSSKPPEDTGQANRSRPPAHAGPTEKREGPIKKPCRLDELPSGFMGKMMVYKSGAIKLKLGDMLYDVSTTITYLATNTQLRCSLFLFPIIS